MTDSAQVPARVLARATSLDGNVSKQLSQCDDNPRAQRYVVSLSHAMRTDGGLTAGESSSWFFADRAEAEKKYEEIQVVVVPRQLN